MKFCTVATHAERYFPCLLESCARHHCELVVLGWNQKWRGFTWRYQLMRDFLKQQPDTEIIVFIDAFDVVILRDAQDIENIFRSMNVPVLVSAEKDYPNVLMRAAYRKMYPNKCHGHNICAGAYMGYAGALRRFFADMFENVDCSNPSADDQRLLAEMCSIRPESLAVDRQSDIFLNVHGGSRCIPSYTNLDLDKNQYFRFDSKGRIVNVDTKRPPCILHAPGGANVDAVVERLRLRPPLPPQKMDLNNYWWRSLKHYTKYFVWELLFVVCVLLLLVWLVGIYVHHRRKLRLEKSNSKGVENTHTTFAEPDKPSTTTDIAV